jgi:uncharacterized membrane protein
VPIWPRLSAACCFATLILVLLHVQSPIRALLAAGFVLVCPGLSLVRLIGLEDQTEQIVLGLALSVGAATVVSLGMVYTHLWSPTLGLLMLAVVTLVANCLELR